jgi:hypothetical protein
MAVEKRKRPEKEHKMELITTINSRRPKNIYEKLPEKTKHASAVASLPQTVANQERRQTP